MSEQILNHIQASAISYTVAGDSGISSFLTLFVLGCVEKSDPTLLNMDDRMEFILSSWFSLIVLAILSVMEFLAMCVPVVDELTDTAMTFVIPIVSLVGILGTLGLYDIPEDDDEGINVDLSNFGGSGDDGDIGGGGGSRRLNAATTALTVWKIVVIVSGIVLAITMHFVKMFVRLIGEGWLTNILTILETAWCTCTLLLAIFYKTFAIVIAVCIIGTALCLCVRRSRRTQQQKEEEEERRQRQLIQRQVQLTEQQQNQTLPQQTTTTEVVQNPEGTTTTTTTTTTVVTTTAADLPTLSSGV